jgi:hypothetical protein
MKRSTLLYFFIISAIILLIFSVIGLFIQAYPKYNKLDLFNLFYTYICPFLLIIIFSCLILFFSFKYFYSLRLSNSDIARYKIDKRGIIKIKNNIETQIIPLNSIRLAVVSPREEFVYFYIFENLWKSDPLKIKFMYKYPFDFFKNIEDVEKFNIQIRTANYSKEIQTKLLNEYNTIFWKKYKEK